MERKLIKQGGGGYTIYLPKKWVDSKGLKEGTTVEVNEKDNSLIIGAISNTKSEIEIEINSENKKDIKILLTHAYRRGIDKINVRNVDENVLKDIKKNIIPLLLGFEITKNESKSVTLENISEPKDQKFNVILDRLLLITSETIGFIIEEIKKGKYKNIEEMQDIRTNHDRFLLFCRRLITKGNVEGNPVLLWEFLTFLQHIEHNLYYIYSYLNENNPKLSEKTYKIFHELKDYFAILSDSYKEKSLAKIHLLNNNGREKSAELIKYMEYNKLKEGAVLSYIRETYRLIQVGSSPILSMVLENK